MPAAMGSIPVAAGTPLLWSCLPWFCLAARLEHLLKKKFGKTLALFAANR